MTINRLNYFMEIFVDELSIFEHYFNVLKSEIDKKGELLEQEYERIESSSDDENMHPSTIWDEANKKLFGTGNFPFPFHMASIAGGFCIIIYHAFERFLQEFVEQLKAIDIDYYKELSIEPSKVELGKSIDKFYDLAKLIPKIQEYSSYKKIDELRNVCNVFKHGTGSSLRQLETLRPDMVRWSSSDFGRDIIRPFAGVDIELKEDDFYEYLKSLKQFLEEAFNYSKN